MTVQTQNTKYFFKELNLLNQVAKHNEMADLMLELQNHLIQKGYLTDDLCRTRLQFHDSSIKQIVNIFLNVRREYQQDNEPCDDFSYIAVAFDWLSENGIQVNERKVLTP